MIRGNYITNNEAFNFNGKRKILIGVNQFLKLQNELYENGILGVGIGADGNYMLFGTPIEIDYINKDKELEYLIKRV